jgi:hypothetical protein
MREVLIKEESSHWVRGRSSPSAHFEAQLGVESEFACPNITQSIETTLLYNSSSSEMLIPYSM